MKVWITKYALTSGIKELEVEYSISSPDMVRGKDLMITTMAREGIGTVHMNRR